MKTKSDIQLELLREIDEICLKNNLNYIFVGLNSLNAYLNSAIDDTQIAAVAMTQGDMERFCRIVERQENPKRYVEGNFNNPDFLEFYVNYGNRNTTDFHMIALNKNRYHGIHIRLYPICKSADLNGQKIDIWTPRLAKERKFQKLINKRIENNKFWYMKLAFNALNSTYKKSGREKRFFKEIEKNSHIDKWQDIQNCSEVQFLNERANSKYFKDTQRIKIGSIELNIPKDSDGFFSEIYGKDFREIKIKPQAPSEHEIVDAEIGFEEIISETEDVLKEIRLAHEEIVWQRRKVNKEKETVANVGNIVKMTSEQLDFIDMFEENIDRYLAFDLDNEDDFNQLVEELNPVISSLKEYSQYGMTFSISPQSDDLIKRILAKLDEKPLIEKMEAISKREYYIE